MRTDVAINGTGRTDRAELVGVKAIGRRILTRWDDEIVPFLGVKIRSAENVAPDKTHGGLAWGGGCASATVVGGDDTPFPRLLVVTGRRSSCCDIVGGGGGGGSCGGTTGGGGSRTGSALDHLGRPEIAGTPGLLGVSLFADLIEQAPVLEVGVFPQVRAMHPFHNTTGIVGKTPLNEEIPKVRSRPDTEFTKLDLFQFFH